MMLPKWDTEAGRKMWEDGASVREIAEALDTTPAAVRSWKEAHWPRKYQVGGRLSYGRPKKPDNETEPNARGIHLARECKRPCWYMSDVTGGPMCNYFLDTGTRRPCPCGPDCTVRIAKKRPMHVESGEGAVRVTMDRRVRKKRGKRETGDGVTTDPAQ